MKYSMMLIVSLLLLGTRLVYAQPNAGDVLRQLELKAYPYTKKVPAQSVIEMPKEMHVDLDKASKISIFVKRFKVLNATLITAADIEKITKPHQGKKMSLRQIADVAREISKRYRQEGYRLERVMHYLRCY